MPAAAMNARTEIYSPGNNAWILKQDERLFVVETRTCEGFASLDKAPESGLGNLMGAFEMRNDSLVFTAAPPPPPTQAPIAEPATTAPAPAAPSPN